MSEQKAKNGWVVRDEIELFLYTFSERRREAIEEYMDHWGLHISDWPIEQKAAGVRCVKLNIVPVERSKS